MRITDWSLNGNYRPMRGRAFVEVIQQKSRIILGLDVDPRDEISHRGRVLALGPPARLTDDPASPEVPWDVEVGDEIVFVIDGVYRGRVIDWRNVRGQVCVVSQGEICGVYE